MNELIITTHEQLVTIIQNSVDRAVDRAFNLKSVQPQIPDNCDLNVAVEYLHQLGYNIPKSSVYKRSSTNEIPCRRIGRRLIFSRIELQGWLNNQLEQKPRFNTALELSKSAQRKLKKG